MENRAHALAAGAFALVLAAATALAVWWLSGRQEASREILLVTERNVGGLNSQAQVRFRGIRTGRVQDITIDPKDRRLLIVRVRVPDWLPLSTATTAELKSQGLTGLAYIELQDSGVGGQPLVGRDGEPPRIALKPSALDLFGDEMTNTLVQLRQLMARANLLLSDDNLQQVRAALGNLNAATGELNASLKQLPAVLEGARRVVSRENTERLARLVASLEKAGAEAQPAAREVRRLVESLQAATVRLEALGSDTVADLGGNTLPRMNQLLQDLSLNSRQLARLLDDLQRSPQQILFGKPAPAPGPGEAGFAPPGRASAP